MRRSDTELAAFMELPAAAQPAAARLLLHLKSDRDRQDLLDIMTASRRANRRAASDRVTDRSRRLLVGPRLPRETVEAYRNAAHEKGLSLYAWAAGALAAQYRQDTKKRGRGCNNERRNHFSEIHAAARRKKRKKRSAANNRNRSKK